MLDGKGIIYVGSLFLRFYSARNGYLRILSALHFTRENIQCEKHVCPRVYPPLFHVNVLGRDEKKKKKKKRKKNREKKLEKRTAVSHDAVLRPLVHGATSPLHPPHCASLGSRHQRCAHTDARAHACPPITRRCPARGPRRHSDWVNKTRASRTRGRYYRAR